MKFEKIFLILYSFLSYSSVLSNNEIDLVNSFTEHVTSYVTLIKNYPEELYSVKFMYIIQEIAKKFPTIVLNVEEVTAVAANEDEFSIQHFFASRYQYHALKVILLAAEGKNVTRALMDTMKLFENSTIKHPPSKCIIILMNLNESIDYYRFFKFSWANNYLYITVIEIIQNQEHENYFISNSNSFKIMVHQYNPFNNVYKSEPFSGSIELIPDKTPNFHHYELNTGIMEEFPAVKINKKYKGNKILDAIYGIDVQIFQVLKKTLNFSLNVKMVVTDNEHFRTSNTTVQDIYDGLEAGTLDFYINLVSLIGRPSMEGYTNVKPGTFLYPYSYSILIKQYGTYEITSPALYYIIAVLLTITSITIIVLVLKFDATVWTLHNTIQILIGGSIQPEPRKISERIFFVCLIFTYVTFSMRAMENLLKLYMYDKAYSEFNCLNDIIEAKITPYIVDHIKQLTNRSDDGVLQILNKNSKTLSTYNDIDECVVALIHEQNRSVQGCQILEFIGREIEKIFKDDIDERMISLVKQPYTPAWGAMVHSPMSHYVERFDDILRRLLESGLVYLWMRDITKDYLFSLKENSNATLNEDLMNDYEADEATWPTKNVIFALTVCYSISFFIFICEIAWLYLKMKKRIQRIYQHLNRTN